MKNEMKNDEAVSPVIATILMVAITVVLAGVLYVWASDLANNNQNDAAALYQYTASDHASDASSGDDSLFVLQFSQAPDDINWANLVVQVVAADGNPTTCATDVADGGGCELVQFGSDSTAWEKNELIHVTENGDELCSVGPCTFAITITDIGSGNELAGGGDSTDGTVVVY